MNLFFGLHYVDSMVISVRKLHMPIGPNIISKQK